MINAILRAAGGLALVATVGSNSLGWAAAVFVLVAVAMSVMALWLLLRARPNATLLDVARAWSLVLQNLLGAGPTRGKKK